MNHLQKRLVVLLATVSAALGLAAVAPAAAGPTKGESGFREHCAVCHADGGNIIRPEKSLSRADREKNGITSAAAIVRLMRQPGAGMSQFDQETIPDQEAQEIADYILATFR